MTRVTRRGAGAWQDEARCPRDEGATGISTIEMHDAYSHRRRGAGGLVLLACLASLPLPAQELEEIVVTATRRAVDLQDVPVSVSSYSSDFIRDSGVDTLADLSLYAPNLGFSTSSQPTNARIAIRGISSVGNNAIEPAVGVFVDGVYLPRPGALLGNLLDLDAVEVLRGPQGTLFGRNTAAGAILLRSAAPGDVFAGHLEAGAGEYGAASLEGVVSGPLGDALGGRLALRWAERDGYGDNTFDGREIGAQDELAARAKLALAAGDGVEATLTLDYAELDSGGSIVELVNATANPVFDATLNALFGADASTADDGDYVVNQDHQDRLRDEQWGAALDVELPIGEHTLRSISAVRDWQAATRESSLRIPADVLPRITRYDSRSLSQELQLLSPQGGALEYIAGLYLYDEDYDIGQDFDAGADTCIPVVFALAGLAAAQACAAAPQTPAVASSFTQSLTSYAAFAQASWALAPDWSLTAGLRYTGEDKDGAFVQTLPNPVIGSLFRAAEAEPALAADDSALTWLVNLRWFANEDLMLFASASTGFKGGGFNSEGAAVALGADARSFDAETSRNLELGVKSQWLERRMTANVTLYHTVLDDFQDRSFDGLSFLTRNAGSRTQSGFEADLSLRPLEALTLYASLSYLDAEFDRFDAASPLPGDTAPQDLAGKRPHYAPDWQGALVADWSAALGDSGFDGSLRAELTHVGEQNIGGNTNQNPQSMEPSRTLFNLHAGIGGERWRATLSVRNLADEAYCQARFDQPLGEALGAVDAAANTSVQRCVLGEPRVMGLTLRYSF